MDLTMQIYKIIGEIGKKNQRLKAAGFEPKCVIMTNDQRIILESSLFVNTISYTEPMKLIGLPVIINNDIKEIQIGV